MRRITLLMLVALMSIAANAEFRTARVAKSKARLARKVRPMRAPSAAIVFDFNSMDVKTSNNDDNSGDITSDVTLTEGIVSMTIAPSSTTTPNRFWSSTKGPQLRMYDGTLTFSVPQGHTLNAIEFNHEKYWGGKSNAGDVKASPGTLSNNISTNVATWKGNAQEVVFTFGANSQINSISIVVDDENGGSQTEEPEEPVVLPDGVEAEEYGLNADFFYVGEEDWEYLAYKNTIEVAFDGNDVYIGGLALYFPDAFVKGAIEGSQVIVKTGQLVGEDEYGKEYLVGFTDEEDDVDIVFDYDAENGTLTLAEGYYFAETDVPMNPEGYYSYCVSATLTPGGIVTPDLVTLPDGVETLEYTLTTESYSPGDEGWVENNRQETVKVAFDGNDVYIGGLAKYFPDAFVKGAIEGSQVIVKTGQYVGEDNYGEEYIVGSTEDEDDVDIVFDYDAENGTLTLADGYTFAECDNPTAENSNPWLHTEAATLTPGGVELPDVVTLPEGVQTQPAWFIGTNSDGKTVVNELSIAYEQASPLEMNVYVQGLCVFLPDAWVKGTFNLATMTATVPTGQFYGRYNSGYDNYDLYFCGYSGTTQELTDVVFSVDLQSNILSLGEDYFILLNGSEDSADDFYEYYYDITVTQTAPELPEPIVAPEDLVVSEYALTGSRLEEVYPDDDAEEPVEEFVPFTGTVTVGFDGNDVYMKGFSSGFPEGWIKGTLSEDGKQIVVPANQLMGAEDIYMDIFFTGYDEESEALCDYVFDYDAETATISSTQDIYINNDWRNILLSERYTNIQLVKKVETAGTPAAPIFNDFAKYEEEGVLVAFIDFEIPTVSTDNAPLMTDKLSYQILVENANGKVVPLTLTADLYNIEEDMDVIPYTFNNYQNISNTCIYLLQPEAEVLSWKNIGLKSIYTGSGETHESAITWYGQEEAGDYEVVGIADITTERSATYTDLQGRTVSKAQKGLLIKQQRMADGSVKTVKVVRK